MLLFMDIAELCQGPQVPGSAKFHSPGIGELKKSQESRGSGYPGFSWHPKFPDTLYPRMLYRKSQYMFPDTTNLIKKVETYKYQKSVISVAFLGHCRNYGGDIGYRGVLNFMPCLDS